MSFRFVIITLFASFFSFTSSSSSAKEDVKWRGQDVVRNGGPNGKITLAEGVAKTAQLKVWCDSANGYTLNLNDPNATSSSAGKLLLNGIGGDTTKELTYSATLDISRIVSTSTIETASLNLQGSSETLAVNFNGSGDVIPKTNKKVHKVRLQITLDSFNDLEKVAGDYSGTITATITFR